MSSGSKLIIRTGFEYEAAKKFWLGVASVPIITHSVSGWDTLKKLHR